MTFTEMGETDPSLLSVRIRKILPVLPVIVLLVLALAARIWGAWSLRFSTDSDTGIVYLMVRHMLDGSAWPVFFYGQAYMGNVEPAFSAALCALGHYSPFGVNLGTALLGWSTLLVLARWTGDAGGGRRGTIWALLIALIGPPTFYGFQVSPRGGYAVTILLGSLLVWWICRITLEERRTQTIRCGVFFCWGFLAGLAWWSNSLILPALLTAALIGFFGLGRSLWNPRRLLTGGLGFFIGSAPFWIWSFQHHGDSLAILQNLDPAAFIRHVIELFTQRLPDFFEFPQAVSPVWFLGILLICMLPLIAVFSALRNRKDPESLYVGAAALHIALILVSFCATRFADTGLARYLVPLFIPWSLLAAVALNTVAERTHAAVAWILVLFLAASYLHAVPDFGQKSNRESLRQGQARKLQEFCRTHNLPVVYTSFRHHWLNAALAEHPVFITLAGERILSHARQGERNSFPSILNNEGFIGEFLLQTAGDAQCSALPNTPWILHWDFKPPPDASLLSTPIASARSIRRTDLLEPLTDSNLDTTCVLGDTLDPEAWTFHFRKPVSLAGLRLYLDPPDGLPPPLSIDVQPENHSAWQSLLAEIAPTHYFWSGPRPFWGGRFYHFDLRWPETRCSALRIHFNPQSQPTLVHVAELQFLTGLASNPACSASDFTAKGFLDLIGLIRRQHPKIVYADRWVSAQLAESTLPPLRLLREPLIGWNGALAERPVVEWSPGTALVVTPDQAPLTAQLLAEASISMRQTPLGPWVFFAFAPTDWRPEFKTIRTFIWTGQGILRGNAVVPPSPPSPPARATSIHFRNGASLEGISPASPIRVKAGSAFTLRYFWRCPPELDPHSWAVFAHFYSGPAMFQDDHLWLAPFRATEIRHQIQPALFWVDREIIVPAGLPHGSYRVRVGLIDNLTLKRVPCKTDLPPRHNAVELPLEIVVLKQDPNSAVGDDEL